MYPKRSPPKHDNMTSLITATHLGGNIKHKAIYYCPDAAHYYCYHKFHIKYMYVKWAISSGGLINVSDKS